MRFSAGRENQNQLGSPRDRYAVARPTISLHFDPDSGPGWVQSDGQALSPAQPRGATVAFDSLDGLPPGQFRKLVQNLNEEVQARRLAVISREQSSAYRVQAISRLKWQSIKRRSPGYGMSLIMTFP